MPRRLRSFLSTAPQADRPPAAVSDRQGTRKAPPPADVGACEADPSDSSVASAAIRQAQRRAWITATAYAVLASIWIIASDAGLFHTAVTEQHWHVGSVAKGLAFVLVTTLILAWSLRVQVRRHERSVTNVLAAAEASRRSQRTLDALIDASPDLVALFDIDGRCMAYNRVAADVVGLAPHDVIGQTPDQIEIPEAFRPWWPRPGALEVIGPREESFPIAHTRDTRRFDLKLGLLKHRDGQHLGHFLHGNDVTLAYRAFQALAAQEQQYRMLFDASPQPMWVYTVEDRRFRMVNHAALSQYGYTREQFLQLTLDQIRPEQDRARLSAWLAQLELRHPGSDGATAGTRLNRSGIWRHLTSTGRELLVDITSGDIVLDDKPARLVLARDVTDLVRAQDELAKSRDQTTELARHLLRQERVLRQQLAQTLHDHIGQSLAVVRLQVDRLAATCRPHLNEHDQQSADQIGQGLSEIFAQLRTLLVELRPVLLEERGLAEALEAELSRRRAAFPEVCFTLLADGPPRCTRWPPEVEFAALMVAREAIANALRHGRPGQVSLTLLVTPHRGLSLRISDDGTGFGTQQPGMSLGIVGMRERCLGIGAAFDIDSRHGSGTDVRMQWQPTTES